MVQAALPQLTKPLIGITGVQELEHLIKQSRIRHMADQIRQRRNRLAGRGFDSKTKLGRQSDRPQHADRILAIPELRMADHAQDLGF